MLDGQMRLLRPIADVCVLHKSPLFVLKILLGKHANFVTNFCQILFDPKTHDLRTGDGHEGVRRSLHERPAEI